ncbi:MAG: dihydrofolate reductase [Bacteroidales bacterium]|nr:dihydrofolate reductase [Bacteroidales bacterium]
MITIIVATDSKNGIGYRNNLLAHLPGDLQRFKKITMGHCLVMGKKTWESLPSKPLAGRKNIVLTDNELDCFDCAETARSIDGGLALCEPGKEIFIIGGGSVYRQFMPLADRLMVTHMHDEFTGRYLFP